VSVLEEKANQHGE